MAVEPDKELLRKAAAGDANAFRSLAESVQADVYNRAWRMTWNHEDALDLSQEILVKLHRNLRRYDLQRPFAPWFRKMCANTAMNYLRGRRPVRALPMEEAEPTAEDLSEDAELVAAAIRQLPEEYRMVVTMKYYDEMDVSEIASAMEVPEGTVKIWLFRAREILRKKLGARLGLTP